MSDQLLIPNGWELLSFYDCIQKKDVKIDKEQKQNYLENGKYPIIDQGKKYVAGYTNKEHLLYRGKLPVIIFGDHTRILKYIDFPFVAGADGTQIILTNDKKVEPKFFYYKLLDTNITNRGYSRHFSLLKEKFFDVPPLVEQRGIVEVLGTVDEAIRWTDSVIEKAEELKRGLMQRLLTRGIGHTEFKQTELGEIPKTWEIMRYEEVTSRITYGFTNPMPHVKEGPFIITAKDIREEEINYNNAYRTTLDAYNNLITDKCRPNIGDVLITKDGTLGRVAIVDREKICVNQSVAVLKPKIGKILPKFLAYNLLTLYIQKNIIDEAGLTTIKHIQITKLAKWLITLPSINEQEKILLIIDDLYKNVKKINLEKEKLLSIKKGLMQVLLSGQVRVELRADGLHRINDG